MPLKLKGTLKPGQPDRRYYMIRVQVDGRREVLSAGTRDRKVAERREQIVVEAIRNSPTITKAGLIALARGQDHIRHQSALKAAQGVTLSQGFKRCFDDPKIWRDIKARSGYEALVKEIEEFFGKDTPLSSIGEDGVTKITVALLEKGFAKSTVNKRLACLSKVFKVMRRAKDGDKDLPHVSMFDDKNPRTYTASMADETAIFAAVSALDDVKPGPKGGPPRKRDAYKYLRLFRVLVESGMRLGEGLRIRWTDLVVDTIDDTWLIKVHRRKELKNGKAKTIPMTDACRAVLQEMMELGESEKHPTGPFCDLNKRRAQHIWTKAKEAAGIADPECVIHSLRHTLATRLLKSTGNLALVSTWLGHTNIKTTADTYAHVESDSMLEGAAALTKLRGTMSALTQSLRDRE